MAMSLKKLFTNCYGEKTYKHAVDLQKMKVKASIAKNQLIFLERCFKNNILPKSFRLKPLIKSIKGYNIMKDCSKKLVVLAKNNAKQRMYSSLKKVAEIKFYLKNILSEEHYILIQNVTDNSREKEFLKKKKQLIDKYNSLLNKYSQRSNYKTSLIKTVILNLTNEEIPKHYEYLLNLAPKFVPKNKNLPLMDIITSTKSCALDMEQNHKESEAVTLRQNVSNILQKNLNLKITSNLTKDERKALKELQKDGKLRVHEFDKGSGFAILTNDTAKEKIEEQLGKTTKAKIDPISRLTNKIQKKLCKLRKENKFTNKTYFELYPSDLIPPRLYGTIKAHKPEKNFPMRVIVSAIGTPPYGISKYLVDIIQPTLKKNHRKVKNSRSFVSQAQTWKTEPDEMQVSYDVTNLYPSIHIDKAIDVIIQQLSEDYEDLKTRTKLKLVNIQQLIKLCVSECYFLWDNVIWNLLNSGPIGLSVMVVVSESYLQDLEKMLLN